MPAPTLAALEEKPVFPFDYACLEPDAAMQARDAAKAINRIAARHVRLIGKHLLAAKDAIPHGSFTHWVESELGMSARTAQNYMAASRWLENKPEPVSHLPAKVIYALAAPTTPASLVQEVVDAAAVGTVPDGEVIAHRIELAKAAAREVKRLVAAKPGRTEQEAEKVVARSRQARAQRQEEVRADWQQQADDRQQRQQRFQDDLQRISGSIDLQGRAVLQEVSEMLALDTYSFTQAIKIVLSGGGFA